MADTPEQQDATKGEAYLMGLFLPLMANLSAPIRAFYLGIGHATVASWALVSVTIGGVGYLWVDLFRDLNMPITEARVALDESRLRETELRIIEKETALGQSAGELTWILGELNWNVDALQAEMLLVPLPDPSKLIMGWRRRGGGGGGMMVQPVVAAPDGGPVTVVFPFSGEWSSGDELVLSFTQETSTGRRVRWVGSGRVERMP